MKFHLRRQIRRFLRLFSSSEVSVKSEFLRILLCFLCLIIAGSALALIAGKVSGLFGAAHWSLRVLFEDFDSLSRKEYQDIYPFAFLLKLVAHIVVPVFSAVIAARILSIRFFRPNAKHLLDHLIVCGKIPNTHLFIEQLTEAGMEDMVLISDLEGLPQLPLESRVVFFKATPHIALDLNHANIANARALLICSLPGEGKKAFESRAVMVAVTAKGLNRNIYIILESRFSHDVEFLKNIGVNEIVFLNDLLPSLISSCIINDRFSPFLQEVVSNSIGNAFSLEQIPEEFCGCNFVETMMEMKERKNWLVLAIQRRQKIYTNPWKFMVQKDDKAFVLREGEK